MKWTGTVKDVSFTKHQWVIVAQAIEKLEKWKAHGLDPAQAIEVICADFIRSFDD